VGVQVLFHLYLTSAVDSFECSVSWPGHFTARMESQHQFSRRLGGPESRSGYFRGEKKLFFQPGFLLPIVQPIT
jgi:hypothetical protein